MQPQHAGNSSFSSSGGTNNESKPREVIDQAKQSAGSVVEQTKEEVATRLTDQIGQTSEGLRYASEELRRAGNQLRQHDQAQPIAQVADKAAEQMDRVASYLKNKDLDTLVSDAERFAREKPAMFLGSAFGLGLLAARFLKSSPQPQVPTGEMNRMGAGPSTTTSPMSHTPPGYHPDQAQPPYRSTGMGNTAPPAASGTSSPTTSYPAPATPTPATNPTSSQTTSSLPAPTPQHPGTATPGTSTPGTTTPGTTRPAGTTDDKGSSFRQSA